MASSCTARWIPCTSFLPYAKYAKSDAEIQFYQIKRRQPFASEHGLEESYEEWDPKKHKRVVLKEPVGEPVRPGRMFSKLMGLERLIEVDFIIIRACDFRDTKLIPYWEKNCPNGYDIVDRNGERIFQAVDDGESTGVNCCRCRPKLLELTVYNQYNYKVLKIEGDPGCCKNKAIAEVHDFEQVYGDLKQVSGGKFGHPIFDVRDAEQNTLFKIYMSDMDVCRLHPPFGRKRMQYEIWDEPKKPGRRAVGYITKNPSGTIYQWLVPDANYCLTFDPKLSVKAKTLLIASAFLLDYEFFKNRLRTTAREVGLGQRDHTGGTRYTHFYDQDELADALD